MSHNNIFDLQPGPAITERQEAWGRLYYDATTDEFSADIYEGCTPIPERPIGAGWLVTGPCNLKCIHCYGNAEDLPRKAVSTETQLHLADQIIRAGVMRQILSGGEPLLRKDTFLVIDKLTDHGIATILGTNGTFIDDQNVATLTKCTRVELSLDSANEARNNFIRPSRSLRGNTYRETLDAIKRCQDAGVKLRILTCLNRHNTDELSEIANFLYERGIRDWAVSWTLSAGRAKHIYGSLMPEYQRDISSEISQLRDIYPDMTIRGSNRTTNYDRYYFLIWPNGTMGTEEISTGDKRFYSSLITGSVEDSWNDDNYDRVAHFKKWVADRWRIVRNHRYAAVV